MACHRSRDVDLQGFLSAPRDREFEDFRLHYPRCAECAAEVRAWTELHEALAAAHPEPEQLARYEALPPADRAGIARHLAGCPGCREELRQLAAFDPARLTEPAAPREPRRSWLAGLGGVVWSPAFAYGVAVLLAIPVVQRVAQQDARQPLAEQVFAQAPATLDAPMELDALAEPERRRKDARVGEVAKRSVAQKKAQNAPAPRAAAVLEEAAVADFADEDLAQERAEPARMALGKGVASSFAAKNELKLAPGSPFRISVPVRPGAGAREAWLRLVSADGRRELRERVRLPAEGRVEVSVPNDWLTPGSYRVELEGASFAFEVAGP